MSLYFLTIKKGVWGCIKTPCMRNDINGPFKFLDVMCDWFLWSNQDLQVYQSSAFQVRIGFYVGILLSLSLKTSILWFPGSAAWTLCLSKPSRSTIGWRDSSTVSCAPRTKIITQTKNNQESKNVSNSQNISGNVPYFWTSGRLCDFDGCDRPDFFPKNINGWFWSANQARLSPTNGSAFHDWSGTGGFSPPRPQPDNREQIQQVAYLRSIRGQWTYRI